jgi:WD40 repeat protein
MGTVNPRAGRQGRRECLRRLSGLALTGLSLLAGCGSSDSPAPPTQSSLPTPVPSPPRPSITLPTSTPVPLPPTTPRPLPPGAITPANADRVRLISTLTGHTDAVWRVAISPDGQTVASASSDATARLWRAADGALLHTLVGHTSTLFSVAFSPDGQTLASGAGTEVRLWRVADGAPQRTLTASGPPPGRGPWVRGLAFSPDGQTLASGWDDRVVRLWRVADGALARTFVGHEAGIRAVTFSSDGQLLASASNGPHPHSTVGSDTVRLWRVADGAVVHILRHGRSVNDVAFSPDDQLLATALPDLDVELWRVSDGRRLRTVKRFGSWSVAFSADGQLLATTDHRDVQLRHLADNAVLRTLRGHTDVVTSVVFSSDGQLLASGSWDDTVRLWAVR